MKIKLFTHVDLDGIGCSVLAKLLYEEFLEVEYVNYDNVNEKIGDFLKNTYIYDYEKIFITDISVNKEIANEIEAINESNYPYNKIILFDHHQTAEWLSRYDWARVDIKESGTSLFYNYLITTYMMPQSVEDFVGLVKSYDTWEWVTSNNQLAKDLNDVLYIIGREEFINSYTEHLQKDEPFVLITIHKQLLKYKRLEIDSYIENKMNQIIIMNRIACVMAESNISELGSKICNEIECDFCAIFTGVNISLRSKGDFDVSEIAKLNRGGGGGHKNAAGIPLKGDLFEKIFESILQIPDMRE
jgi:uncharacterized protein